MIDFSHANSRKEATRQIEVCDDVSDQIRRGNSHIIGVMIESHLIEGRQDIVPDHTLTYGQSVTDACLGWDKSSNLLGKLASAVVSRRKSG